jgi:4-hydroxybenzoate polyprenyltransferase/phosphoserine phosphatase
MTAAPTGRDRPASATSDEPPLVIDLDGTLLRTDLLHESALSLAGNEPWLAWRLPFWLFEGKAQLKRRIATRVELDIATLPYHAELLEWIRAEHARGRRIVLCSASDAKFAEGVANHLGLFHEVMASDGVINLSSHRKADALVRRFGARGFDYAGNSRADIPVWQQARQAVPVAASAAVRHAAARSSTVEREFVQTPAGLSVWLRALRLHQWVKNLLVFLTLLASHRFLELPLLASTVVAFFAFGLCASSVYVLNDLIDLQNDRVHPRKRNRPFAAGTLSPVAGLVVSLACLVGAFALGLAASAAFEAWLGVYLVVTLLYTFLLKRKILVDALALAALYTLRIIAGGAAADMWPGFWLLALSLFLFLSLAFVKRYSELEVVLRQGRQGTRGRDYLTSDLPLIEMFGIASGFATVLVMALYINGESIERLYPHQAIVWLTVPILLYWITRMWVKAHRGEMHDDPVVFAMTDGLSQVTIAAFLGVMLVAGLPW